MDRQEIYASLAEEYGFDISVVNHCVETLSFYDFARDGEEEQFLTCLEMVLQSLCSMEFMTEHKLNDVRLQLQMHKFIWDPDKRGV